MIFDGVKLFDMDKFIPNNEDIYAHLKEDRNRKDDIKERLKEHSDLAYSYFLKLCEEKKLNGVFKNLENVFFGKDEYDGIKLWEEMVCNAIYMHDLGKINSGFQYRKMRNEKYENKPTEDSKHSMLSACIYFDYFFKKIRKFIGNIEENKNLCSTLLTFLFLNSYIISRHHSSFDDLYEFGEKFQESYKKYRNNKIIYEDYNVDFFATENHVKAVFKLCGDFLKNYDKSQPWNCMNIYIYTKFVYSLLVASDFYSTSEFINGNEIKKFGTIKDVDRFYDIYKENKNYKSIRRYEKCINGEGIKPYKDGDINELRSSMFLEAEKNLENHLNENIFYLEAPTGSGKTNTSINLAFKMLKNNSNLNKIFYIFPFNTLVEQTKKSLNDIFKGNKDIQNDITVVNSITPIKLIDEEEDNKLHLKGSLKQEINYERAVLDRQFLHYPIVLTTHVGFFSHLFGNEREEVFPLVHLANSVVILDEIQSYRNDIWKEIILFLKKYTEILNIKIIIMSATLPKLDKLTDTKEEFVSLIENKDKYFKNPLFKNRVKPDYSLLNVSENLWDRLKEKLIEVAKSTDKNIAIEFITKKSAEKFYDELYHNKELSGKKILLLTGDNNKFERNEIIKDVNDENNIILVSTQIIEAGLDVDMYAGFKDISILDSEEQFMGRINRSCLKKMAVVYFFDLDKASTVYKKDYRKDSSVTLKQGYIRDILENKDFDKFYEIIMRRIEENLNRENPDNIKNFRESIIELNYRIISKRMELISDDMKEYTVFINREVNLEKKGKLIGREVWQEYKKVLMDKNIGYAEKKVKLSEVMEKMSYFIYKVRSLNVSYNDLIGEIFYLEDGEKYFEDGKFKRALLEEGNCDIL
jgi:CRISPR-associated endonuclease/helicase Cas3